MKLNELTASEGAVKARKRVGRGIGSGTGKTSGRGHKGQKARSGVALKGFEGGQQPIYRRLPKRGFTSLNKFSYQTVNLGQLSGLIEASKINATEEITAEVLANAGAVRAGKPVKLLANGEIKVAVNINIEAASAKAIELVAAAGGSVKTL